MARDSSFIHQFIYYIIGVVLILQTFLAIYQNVKKDKAVTEGGARMQSAQIWLAGIAMTLLALVTFYITFNTEVTVSRNGI